MYQYSSSTTLQQSKRTAVQVKLCIILYISYLYILAPAEGCPEDIIAPAEVDSVPPNLVECLVPRPFLQTRLSGANSLRGPNLVKGRKLDPNGRGGEDRVRGGDRGVGRYSPEHGRFPRERLEQAPEGRGVSVLHVPAEAGVKRKIFLFLAGRHVGHGGEGFPAFSGGAQAALGGHGGGEEAKVVAGVSPLPALELERLLVPVLELDPLPGRRRVETNVLQVRHVLLVRVYMNVLQVLQGRVSDWRCPHAAACFPRPLSGDQGNQDHRPGHRKDN